MKNASSHLFSVVDDVTEPIIRVENAAVSWLEVMYDDRRRLVLRQHINKTNTASVRTSTKWQNTNIVWAGATVTGRHRHSVK